MSEALLMTDHQMNLEWATVCWPTDEYTVLPKQQFWDDKSLINSGALLGTARGLITLCRAIYEEMKALQCPS